MARINLPRSGAPEVLIEAAPCETLGALEREEIVALYTAHGALQLRWFATDLAQFGALALRFCKTAVVNESPNREPLDPANRIHSVDCGAGVFPLHPELSREPWKPDAAFFACLSAPGEGGETTICDGVALARALPGEVREGLAGRRLVYGMGTWPGLLDYWLGTPEPNDALLAAPPAGCPYRSPGGPTGESCGTFRAPRPPL